MKNNPPERIKTGMGFAVLELNYVLSCPFITSFLLGFLGNMRDVVFDEGKP
jgi:hypothetical protein